MRLAAALTLLFSACLTYPAFADSTYTFTVTDTNAPGTLGFSLRSASPYTTDGFGDFDYSNVSGSVNGTPDTFTYVDITPSSTPGPGDYLTLTDSSEIYLYSSFTGEFLSGTPDGTAPVITPGSFSGFSECAATLRSPFAKTSGLPVTMAFLQMQSPFDYSCGDPLQLAVAGSTPAPPPTSVTPEPSTLGLMATGTLGLAGVIRRRMRV